MLGPQPWASQGTRELIHIAWSFGPQVAEAAMKVFPPGVQTSQVQITRPALVL